MSTNSQNAPENQEIDLSQISKKIGKIFEDLSTSIFKGILFLKRNIIWLALLFIGGAVWGYFLDSDTKVYNHEIIVTPNFSANDYLYAQIELISSKISEGDTLFLKNVVGIKQPKKLKNIEIKPIVDVYKFIEGRPDYFELIKLMAEDGDITKIIIDPVTSKNYTFHKISLTTDKLSSDAMTIAPIMAYLNQSNYFDKVKVQYRKNIANKMIENDSLIGQINGFLNSFSNKSNGQQKSSSLVYYNENTQLNDIIKTKEALVAEQGSRKLELINSDQVIKEISSTINIRNNKATNGKMKLLLPFLFVFLFILGGFIRSFYRRQMAKQKLIS